MAGSIEFFNLLLRARLDTAVPVKVNQDTAKTASVNDVKETPLAVFLLTALIRRKHYKGKPTHAVV
jgi:hypothetical protein